MQIGQNNLFYSYNNSVRQNQDVKQTDKESLLIEEYKNLLNVTEEPEDEKEAAELEECQQEVAFAKLSMDVYKRMLASNQRSAQYGNCAFVKMITDTTDIAGMEIMTNFSSFISSLFQPGAVADVNKIKNAIDEALAKLETLLTLSNAAIQASDIIQKMHEAGVDDTEIRQIFEDYANNMNTSIGGVSEMDNKSDIKNKSDSKNISNTKENSEIDNKIQELKNKIREAKNVFNNKTNSGETRQKAGVQIEAYSFLLETYKEIKKAIKPLNKNLLDNLGEFFG